MTSQLASYTTIARNCRKTMENSDIRNMMLEEREENFEIIEEFLNEKDHEFEVGEDFKEVIGTHIVHL